MQDFEMKWAVFQHPACDEGTLTTQGEVSIWKTFFSLLAESFLPCLGHYIPMWRGSIDLTDSF